MGQARPGYQAIYFLAVLLSSWPTLGTALVPYGLPCIRELFRFLISLTNPHDRHNSEVMIHMGLHLLTVALESAPVAQCQTLLGLIKDEMCRHLFQVRLGFWRDSQTLTVFQGLSRARGAQEVWLLHAE